MDLNDQLNKLAAGEDANQQQQQELEELTALEVGFVSGGWSCGYTDGEYKCTW